MRIRTLILCSLFSLAGSFCAGAQEVLPNMNFDTWSKSGGCWNPYPKDAQTITWDTANHGLSLFGINGATPEYNHVAVKGKGKAAVKVETKKAFGILVAGTIYTGRFIKIVRMSGAKIEMGVPFTGRPKSLSGYIHYIPGTIDVASKEIQHVKGTMDNAKIEVSLREGKNLEIVDSTDKDFNKEAGASYPGTVAHGVMYFKQDTKGYIKFEIPLEYKSGHTPTNIVITASSSRYSQQFTGSTKSVMYLDELQLNY